MNMELHNPLQGWRNPFFFAVHTNNNKSQIKQISTAHICPSVWIHIETSETYHVYKSKTEDD